MYMYVHIYVYLYIFIYIYMYIYIYIYYWSGAIVARVGLMVMARKARKNRLETHAAGGRPCMIVAPANMIT